MEQLLCHLLGDHFLQTNWMVRNKVRHWFPALVHASVYALPFLLLKPSWAALGVILFSHFLIDHCVRAKVYFAFAKSWLSNPALKWEDCKYSQGYPAGTPPWYAMWFTVLSDETLHLCINYAALRWL